MLNSLEVIQASGISRGTLNNYIGLGLLPRPLVRNPGNDSRTRARQIGYFPQSVIDRIERIQLLKKEGMTMADIVRQLSQEGFEGGPQAQTIESTSSRETAALQPPSPKSHVLTAPLRLTIDKLSYPAYMLNYKLELTWYNEEAGVSLLGSLEKLSVDTKERNILDLFSHGAYGQNPENREAFRQLNGQFRRASLSDASSKASLGNTGTATHPITEWPLHLRSVDGGDDHYRVYASYFREGILVIIARETTGHQGLLGMLERHDDVIRNLLKKRIPMFTEVAVMMVDLENSVRICSELPAEEYFELINQIWATMDPIFRRYYGTHGKHVSDGMLYYFFPQPDCNYVYNAVRCANEIRDAMRKISKEWQLRKNWLNELYLNTGLNEGQEWLGIFHNETKVEFTLLGDTITHAARLANFALHGSLWATKNFMEKLSAEERNKVRFGVRRQDHEKREVFIKGTYSRISELVDLTSPRYEKLRDIPALAVTEIVEVG